MEKKKERYIYRSAITGRFVKKEFAQKHPETTIREKIK
ncbi:multidrug transporter [Candidatus Dependentiae bacterium]|nr:multidrug transporter [Candidatus Dependentiae bacterium]